MEQNLYEKLATPEGKMDIIMSMARQFGYDRELLYLVGGFLFPDRINQEDMVARLKEFKETQYSKLDPLQKSFFLLGFRGYMLVSYNYNKEVVPLIDEVIKFIKGDEK